MGAQACAQAHTHTQSCLAAQRAIRLGSTFQKMGVEEMLKLTKISYVQTKAKYQVLKKCRKE